MNRGFYMHTKYLVIGVNAAGFHAMEALREYDSRGSIAAINGELYPDFCSCKVKKQL